MNGLKYIRTRCNLSLSELADYIGVTRQIISAWETGTRNISAKNLKRLEDFFGIEGKYFGEISDDEHRDILKMPMYMYNNNGSIHYRYTSSDGEYHPQEYYPEMECTLDEQYRNAVDKKQKILDQVDECIKGNNGLSSDNILIRSTIMQSQSWFFEQMVRLLDNKLNQRPRTMLAYQTELHIMVQILLSVFGVEDNLDVIQGFHNCDENDVEWSKRIRDDIRDHLSTKQQMQLDEIKKPKVTYPNPFPDGEHYCVKG